VIFGLGRRSFTWTSSRTWIDARESSCKSTKPCWSTYLHAYLVIVC